MNMNMDRKNHLENSDQLARAAIVFQALSHEVRLQLCNVLIDEELSVTQLCERLDLAQHKVSQQLALLREANILVARKQSRQVFYSLDEPLIRQILNIVRSQSSGLPFNSFEAGKFSEVFG